jgi:hypothetical protein
MARGRTLKLYPTRFVGVEITSNVQDALQRLEAGIYEKVLRSGAYAGAAVFYNEMRQRVPIGETGNLYASIYHWHDDKLSKATQQIYMIGPNKVKAPHWHNVEYGHWRYNRFANGRWQRSKSNPNARGPGAHDLPGALAQPVWTPAKPYIRPTFDARAQSSLTAIRTRMAERLRELNGEIAAT